MQNSIGLGRRSKEQDFLLFCVFRTLKTKLG